MQRSPHYQYPVVNGTGLQANPKEACNSLARLRAVEPTPASLAREQTKAVVLRPV